MIYLILILNKNFNIKTWDGKRRGWWSLQEHCWIDDQTISKVKNAVLDQIVDKYGQDKIKYISSYDESRGLWLDYLPGVTDPNSDGNFDLVGINKLGYREEESFILYCYEDMELEVY